MLHLLDYTFFSIKNWAQWAQERKWAATPTGTACLIGNIDIWNACRNALPLPPTPPQVLKHPRWVYNISFIPAPNPPPMSPAASAPPDHCFWHCLHVFASAPNPCSTAPPSHLAPSVYQPLYPLTQRTLLLILTNPSIMVILSFTLFFGWWATAAVDLWTMLGTYHLLT